MIETVVVLLVMAISAAVVLPKWSSYQADIKARSAALAFSADLRALQRYAMRNSQSLTLSITTGGSTLSVNPPVPILIGDNSGNVDYSRRYPGVTFQSAAFNGAGSAEINMWGELISTSTGNQVDSAQVGMGIGSQLVNVDLLSALNLSGASL